MDLAKRCKCGESGRVYCDRKRRPCANPWMVCPRNSDALSKWRDKAGAEAECARLNGEGGAS